ncbi:MAG: MFS transporter [Pseudomonadota bacterium]
MTDKGVEFPDMAPAKASNPGPVPGFCTSANRRFVLVAAILASALAFIDGTIIAIALPAMRDALGADLVQAQWINNGYMLPLSALILLGGALGDRFGTARSFAWGIGIFVIASILCAFAPTAETLIAGRVLKGIGAAVMIPGSLALITKAYPKAERGRAIGIWAAASALTTALGPIIGGIALEYGGPEIWRWLFGINLPFGAIALWLVLTRVAHDPSQPDHPLDSIGAVLITAALGLIAWGLTGGAEGIRMAPVLLGFGFVVAFIVWEGKASSPMVPLALFRVRAFAAANLATATLYFALTTILFFLPMTMIAGWGLSEVLASAAFAPLSVFISTLSVRAGSWADQYGPGLLIGGGSLLVALAFALLAILASAQSFWVSVLPGTVIMGLGMALVVSPLSTAIMGSVDEDRAGAASGINNAVSRVAGLVAVAAMGSVAALIYATAGGPDSFGSFSDAPGHGDAMTVAYQTLAWVTAALAAASGVIAYVFIGKPAASSVS